MKRCPFCAEEIQGPAIFCRYCRRRVKTNPYLIMIFIIFAIIIISLAIFVNTHRTRIAGSYRSVKTAIGEFRGGCYEFFNSIRQLPESIKAMKEHNKALNSMINDMSRGATQDTDDPSEN